MNSKGKDRAPHPQRPPPALPRTRLPNPTPPTPRPHCPRVLITAGPTHEPIDAVRFIGNRSSGRMGSALATECAHRGWAVTLLLGPVTVVPTDPRIQIERFRTTSDLQVLLRRHVPTADILIMAAAVADYRPKVDPAFFGGKFRRKSENLHLELEPTPDLLAEVSTTRKPGQLFVGFALEPRDELVVAACSKMQRKKIDMVVANPLETMDSDSIEATVFYADATPPQTFDKRPKTDAAPWLLDLIDQRWHAMKAGRVAAHV